MERDAIRFGAEWQPTKQEVFRGIGCNPVNRCNSCGPLGTLRHCLPSASKPSLPAVVVEAQVVNPVRVGLSAIGIFAGQRLLPRPNCRI